MEYIYLRSNDSLDVFNNNTLCDFRVKLPTVKELVGEWEIALGEISYPFSWSKKAYTYEIEATIEVLYKNEQGITARKEFIDSLSYLGAVKDSPDTILKQMTIKSTLFRFIQTKSNNKASITWFNQKDNIKFEHYRDQ